VNSALYECHVIHTRFRPKSYRFGFNFFWFSIDLDELDSLQNKLWLFSHNRFNIFQFRDSDHYKDHSERLKDNIIKFVKQNGVNEEVEKIELVTSCRVLGYVFNPVSYYFIQTKSNKEYCLIEICNTFNELKMYYAGQIQDGEAYVKTQKNYYISPFIELDSIMDFRIRRFNDHLDVNINDHEHNQLTLNAFLTARKRKLNNWSLFKFFFTYPLITFRIIFAIHWHALKLFLMKVPFIKKSENPHLQQGAQLWK
jgi:DUF1365 family protein